MNMELVRMPLVQRTVDALIADYERQDGRLEKKQVDRTFEKRDLTVMECQVALEQLDSAGVRLDESDEDATSLHLIADDESKDGTTTLLEQYTSAAASRGVDDYRLLTGPEELELGRAISMGQRAAVELTQGEHCTDLHNSLIAKGLSAQSKMTLANLRLVAHVARPFSTLSDLTAEDLIQEGILGLIRATQKFDHTLGLKFSTYATWWIRQAVTRAIADRGVAIRLPAYMVLEVHRYRRAFRLLHQVNPTRNPTVVQLADELAWPLDRVTFIQHLSVLQPISLDEPIAGAPDSYLIDQIASNDDGPEECAERLSLRKAVASAIAELTESERRVLNLRFGLEDASGGRTLEEVGQQLGVTRERIRQIESKALKRLLTRARRSENYALSIYCPPALLEPKVTDNAPAEPEGQKALSEKKAKHKTGKSTAKKEPEHFPKEYRWLR